MTHVTIETALMEQLVVALEGIEALIEHQYTGTREAMNALQNASDDAQEAIEPLRTALAQQELPQKERPDFMAGYDAGMADAKRMAQQGEQQPVAWYEYNQDLDAWFLAYGHNPKAKTRPLVFGDTAAPAPQAQQMEPTDDQLVKGVKAMRLFVTKNSVADFKLGYMAALAAAPAPQAQDGTFINEGTKSAPKPGFHDCTFDAAPQAQPICKLFGTLPVYDTPAPQPAQGAVTRRKIFVCAHCDGIYADQTVTQCDCMEGTGADFVEGFAEYPAALQSAQPVAQPLPDPCHTCAHYQQGKLPGVRIHDETCYECRSYWGNKWEAA